MAFVVLGGCVLVVLTLVVLFLSWRRRLDRSVEAQLQAVKAAGLPTSGSELNSWYASVPDEQNAALLRYKQLPKGYVVYSVGPDGRDDGGKEPPAKNAGRAGAPQDITFTVER